MTHKWNYSEIYFYNFFHFHSPYLFMLTIHASMDIGEFFFLFYYILFFMYWQVRLYHLFSYRLYPYCLKKIYIYTFSSLYITFFFFLSVTLMENCAQRMRNTSWKVLLYIYIKNKYIYRQEKYKKKGWIFSQFIYLLNFDPSDTRLSFE